jgi:molybdopterin-binding protein
MRENDSVELVPLKLGQAAELAGVSPDTVRRWCDDGRLVIERSSGGQRLVDPVSLARLMAEGATSDLPAGAAAQSARNRFVGLVTAVEVDRVAAKVEIQSGPHRIVSLMTSEAVEELGLRPGVLAVASVKATNVVVEVPA